MAPSKKARRDVYAEVTEKVLAQLEAGVVPWRKPWTSASMPMSMSSGRPYRGINVFLLGMAADEAGYSSPWWGTYKQIAERGGQVRKGERSELVILWRKIEKLDPATDEVVERRMILRTFSVFNEAQAEWAEDARRPPVREAGDPVDAIEHCEEMVAEYLAAGPSLSWGGDRAYYRPSTDSVQMPEMPDFEGAEEYYSALFHELTHSTGHKSRLDREGIVEGHRFGDALYSKEELIAEMGAAMLCGLAGIEQATLANSAAYLQSWIDVLKGDAKLIVSAGAAAQRAADLVSSATFDWVETPQDEAVAA